MEMNPLVQIDWRVIVATIVIFVGTYFALRRVYFDPVIEAMEDRREELAECDEECARGRAIVSAAEDDARAISEAAASERDALLERARDEAQQERERLVAEAKTSADARLAEGRAQIESERSAQVERLRTEAAECVGLACSKLVGEVDPDTIAPVVDRIIEKQLA